LSAQDVRSRPHEYAVVWRTGTGPISSGRLELGEDDLVLHGSGEPDGLRIPLDELSRRTHARERTTDPGR
jgi:hypothetical protein